MTCQSLVFDSCGKSDLYARTIVPLVPDHPEDGPGIPAGVIVRVTEQAVGPEESGLTAHYNGTHMDVDISELDTNV
jgi:hypothetical protein